MTLLRLTEYPLDSIEAWDDLVVRSNNGTLFHRLSFLAYHGRKFEQSAHHLLWYKGNELFAVMPFGIFVEGGRKIGRSPFGASWGGIVHPLHTGLKYAMEMVDTLIEYLNLKDVAECYVTPPPACYYQNYTNVVEFALFSKGFQIVRREITHVVLMDPKRDVLDVLDAKCRNQSRKALDTFSIRDDVPAEEFYPILLADKKRHNNTVPTHSLDKLIYLQKAFPGVVTMDVAKHPNGAQAGICYFHSHPRCPTVFYLAQEDACLGLNGLNALIVHGLRKAREKGYTHVDFGCSSIDSKVTNAGVAEFKEGFGAIGLFRDTFRWLRPTGQGSL